MDGSILYCGDTELTGAASYLAGLMTSWGWSFEYVPSHVPVSATQLNTPRSLLIFSDYPASQLSHECQQLAVKNVEQGCGLLMIGGWESFHGFGGNWEQSLLSAALPVEISADDDRMNFDQSAWLLCDVDHEIVHGLPWQTRPPAIGGMNRVEAKASATVLLRAHAFAMSAMGSTDAADDAARWQHSWCDAFPALVVGQYGSGRTAAFLSDVAPHWVGGFVDWGQPRVTAQAANSIGIEVGYYYAQFWKQLLEWTGTSAAKAEQSRP